MQAKKNVKTISTMSSSNYDNSDNSSNIGSKAFKVPKRRFHERDILTECADNHRSGLLNQQELKNCSKDDEWMEIHNNSEEAMNEYLRLIRDSPYLLKRSFLYNREVDQMKDKEQEINYDRSLQSIRGLFGEDQDFTEDKEMQDDTCLFNFSPSKEYNDPYNDDLLLDFSESKNYPKLADNLEDEENSS